MQEFKMKAFRAPWQGEDVPPALAVDSAYYTQQQGYQFIGYATVTIQPASIEDEINELKEVLQQTRAENEIRERAVIDKIKNLECLEYSPEA